MEYWSRRIVFWQTVYALLVLALGSDCDTKCTDCRGQTCHACIDGYYPSEKNCYICTYSACATCSSANSCDTCFSGVWGYSCNARCSEGCNNSICNRFNGSCSCTSGYYGTNCVRTCSTNCVNKQCSTIDGSCVCNQGFYGNTCENTCLHGCQDCDDGSQCTECPVGKYGRLCTNVCYCNGSCDFETGQCDKQSTCPSQCNTCSATGVCTACQTGFYGTQCNQACSTVCDGGCHQNGTCFECVQSNVFGLKCNRQCSILCLNGTCDRWTGECPLKCNSRCELCDSSTGNCTKCNQNNNYGNDCQSYCNAGCSNQTCNHTTGECFSCTVGQRGPYCNISCSSGCSSSGCDRDSGNCKNCVTNRYGSGCQLPCSENCRANPSGSSCDINGTCLYGCVNDFTGNDCRIGKTNKSTSLSTTTATPSDGDADQQTGIDKPGLPVAAIGGGVGGLVFLIVIILLVVVLLRRRRKSQKNDPTPMQDLNNEYHTIDIVSEANKRLSTRSNGVQETPVVTTSEYELEDVVAPPVPGNEEEEADKFLEIDDDEAQRKEKRRVAPPLEENVYYISLQEIQKRKVRVSDLPAFVADKTMAYYEEEFDKFPEGITKTANAAKLPVNVGKNRYKGLYAYDDSRVKVSGFDTDYINANYIDGYKKRNAYIASLGPMKKQMGDYGVFWAMVWQQKVEKIVMVTKLKEEGRDKCEQYWPSPGQSHVYGGVKVTCQRELVFAEFTRRQLVLSMGSKSRKVHHLHFTAWPDKGIPDDVTTLVEFRQRVLNASSTLDGPTLVHCSAGIGRTGTYIALDSLTKEGEAEGAVEIPGCIINMRQNRTNMVQTAEQYEFLHHALVHTLTLACAQIPADTFPQYMIKTSAAEFAQQFKRLSETDHIVSDEEISAIERNKSEKNNNRKGADIPGDAHRPHLYLGISHQQSDYVNAVYINGFRCRRRFLLAQTPIPGSVVDFLTMAFQENCVAIVSFQEDGDRKDVGTYYPADNQVLHKGKFTVHSSKVNGSHQYTIQRELTIEFSGVCTGDKTRKIQHYVFTDWDTRSNVPGSPERFLAFIEKMKTLSGGPILIHCRDGGGRSGLFCAVASLLEKVKVEREVSVVNAVRRVKARRPNAIHCQAQFDFCHQCVLCHINSDNDYVNCQEEAN